MVDFLGPWIGLSFSDFSDFSHDQSFLQVVVSDLFFCLVERAT